MKKLALGRTAMTRALHDICRRSDAMRNFCVCCLARHARGDWGSMDPEDLALNDRIFASGEGRILSSYPLPGNICSRIVLPDNRVWVITYPGVETTVMFPSDY